MDFKKIVADALRVYLGEAEHPRAALEKEWEKLEVDANNVMKDMADAESDGKSVRPFMKKLKEIHAKQAELMKKMQSVVR